ncbi:hypothetical protein AMTR_s00054p00124330 [Amborella trichopoda]|uniref:Uncharacterized protein n=1 Tax=Amborella trichopoda TaxID=13333 RepID=U5CXU8_AMBTC|nr:hypothetical protein AMTR_s00054p00124330 [Amborella trichopoda]
MVMGGRKDLSKLRGATCTAVGVGVLTKATEVGRGSRTDHECRVGVCGGVWRVRDVMMGCTEEATWQPIGSIGHVSNVERESVGDLKNVRDGGFLWRCHEWGGSLEMRMPDTCQADGRWGKVWIMGELEWSTGIGAVRCNRGDGDLRDSSIFCGGLKS